MIGVFQKSIFKIEISIFFDIVHARAAGEDRVTYLQQQGNLFIQFADGPADGKNDRLFRPR